MKKVNPITLNQYQALAAPRRSVSTAGVASSTSGISIGSAYSSRAWLARLRTVNVTRKPASGSTSAGRANPVARARHSVHNATGQTGHAYHGRMRR